MKTSRISSLLCLVLAVLYLSGCAGTDHGKSTQSTSDPGNVVESTGASQELTQASTEAADITLPVQQEMDKTELSLALERAEYQMVAAALATEHGLEEAAWYSKVGWLGDRNGKLELIFGNDALTFTMDPEKTISYRYSPSGIDSYYTDNAGDFYIQYPMDEIGAWSDNITVDGQQFYCSGTEYGLAHNGSDKIIWYIGTLYNDEFEDQGEYRCAKVNGQELTWEEFESYADSIGLKEISTAIGEYTVYSYDSVYTQSLIDGLDAALAENHTQYCGQYTANIDQDNLDETVFIVPDFMDSWFDPWLESLSEFDVMSKDMVSYSIDPARERTAVLVVDPCSDQVQVHAFCMQDVSAVYEDMTVTWKNHYLDLGPYRCFAPLVTDDVQQLCELMEVRLTEIGYSNIIIKLANVADVDGDELVCLCQKDGQWYLRVFVVQNGFPMLLYSETLSSNAAFLTEHEGEAALLIYNQNISQNSKGIYETSYFYHIIRFGSGGGQIQVDNQWMRYDENSESAAEVAAFFSRLNGYLLEIIVLHDPFALTGHTWITPEETDYGTAPEEEEQEAAEQLQMGFVQIEDPDSWLHLRVGPGTESEKVLMDAGDPDSFVRQANGSPVTILETVEADDAENPVWAKIRIRYEGVDIVGYSSMRYIRLADET